MLLHFIQECVPIIVVFLITFIIGLTLTKTVSRPFGLPPGPIPLPIIGNILQTRGDIRTSFRKLRRKYGDVFALYLGSRLTIVINGPEAIKEAFVKRSDVFSDRPAVNSPFPQQFIRSRGIITSNGDVWNQNRRFFLTTMRNFGMGKNIMQKKIQEELIHSIAAVDAKDGRPFDIRDTIHATTANVICSVLFGHRFAYDDEVFNKYVHLLENCLAQNNFPSILQSIPLFTKLFLRTKYGKGKYLGFVELYKFLHTKISECLKSYDENNVRCMVDAYIKEQKLNAKEITPDKIYDIQSKMRAEILNAVPEGHPLTMGHITKLPFLESVITEVLRHSHVSPMSMTHMVRENVVFRGYFIPKEANVILNIDSVMSDPELWQDAEKFVPTRFLHQDLLSKPDYYFPFSVGKRSCPGESLARMELFLLVGTLIQNFQFLPESEDSPPPLQGTFGLTYSPNRYKVRAVRIDQSTESKP